MEAPLSSARTSDKQGYSPTTLIQFKPMRILRLAIHNISSIAPERPMGGMFSIGTGQDDGRVVPRVIVKSPVIVAMQNLVKVNRAKWIARNNPPSPQVIIANHEIGVTTRHQVERPNLHLESGHHFHEFSSL